MLNIQKDIHSQISLNFFLVKNEKKNNFSSSNSCRSQIPETQVKIQI